MTFYQILEKVWVDSYMNSFRFAIHTQETLEHIENRAKEAFSHYYARQRYALEVPVSGYEGMLLRSHVVDMEDTLERVRAALADLQAHVNEAVSMVEDAKEL